MSKLLLEDVSDGEDQVIWTRSVGGCHPAQNHDEDHDEGHEDHDEGDEDHDEGHDEDHDEGHNDEGDDDHDEGDDHLGVR